METRTYHVENLDCANCAAKIETKINAHPRVHRAVLTFTTGQLTLTAEEPDALLPELQKLARTVEPEVTFLPGGGHCHGEHKACACGHAHHDHEHHEHEHHDHEHHGEADSAREKWMLLVGGGLFLLGLALNRLPVVPQLVLLAAYAVLGGGVLKTALNHLLRGHVFDENFLMSLATLGAFCIGEFPEAVGVMLFFRVGEFFEHRAVERSRSQIMEAVDLRPETVNRLEQDTVRVIPAGEARVGDLLLVRPGDRIPLDGVVTAGESRIDTAPITGEPVSVFVHAGDRVTSGCVNLQGQLTVRVEKVLAESMVTRILESVENAAASKPKMDRFITRFARIYTPIVVGAAALTAVVPSLITGDWGYWVYTALSFLVMSCPCALVLSVPLAFFSGIGAGSRRGILFKGGLSIEALSQVRAVVMDKTGTLTRGVFAVQEITGDETVLALAAGCEQQSTHPIAAGIVAEAKARGLRLQRPEWMEELAGLGIRARLEGREILLGNRQLLEKYGITVPEPENKTGTTVFLAAQGTYLGRIRLADAVKPDAKAAVARLKKRGIATAMLTGDRAETAGAVAAEIGLDEAYASLLPQEKLEKLREIREKRGAALFVGDGINDAPVLAGADVGAAMGSGADAALEAADVVFMTSEVQAIPEALEIAAETRRIAWQNVAFALGVKAAVMLLGLLGHASMWMAVFADSGVAMLCVVNAVRLLYRKK